MRVRYTSHPGLFDRVFRPPTRGHFYWFLTQGDGSLASLVPNGQTAGRPWRATGLPRCEPFKRTDLECPPLPPGLNSRRTRPVSHRLA